MPCVQNFQALISVHGKYLQEFKTRSQPTSWGGMQVDALVESPTGQPFKILFGTIDPQLQENDLIAYVLIDGNLVGSRILLKTDAVSSCQISGMSLSATGLGPVELAEKCNDVHFTRAFPAVPGSIRILLYRGTATVTKEPSLFNYPSFICPFQFVENMNPEACSGLDHITGFSSPVPVALPPTTYSFESSDATQDPITTIDFFYRCDRQLSEQLSRQPERPRALSPPPPAPVPRLQLKVARPVAHHLRILELGGGGSAKKKARTEVSSARGGSTTPTSPSFPSPVYAIEGSSGDGFPPFNASLSTVRSPPAAHDPATNVYGPPPASVRGYTSALNTNDASASASASASESASPSVITSQQKQQSVLRKQPTPPSNNPYFPSLPDHPPSTTKASTLRSPLGSRTANFILAGPPANSVKQRPASNHHGLSTLVPPANSSKGKRRARGLDEEESEDEHTGNSVSEAEQAKGRAERALRRARPYPASSVGGRTGGRGR